MLKLDLIYVNILFLFFPFKVIKLPFIKEDIFLKVKRHDSNPNKDYFISVVVCVHNKQKYLPRCMNSIILDPLFDFCEFIFVDDYSTDRSLSIIKTFAMLYSNIKVVVHNSNYGTLRARISGIKIASGKYTICLDPDDTVITGAYQFLYNTIEELNADALSFSLQSIEDERKTSSLIKTIENVRIKDILETNDAIIDNLIDVNLSWSLCTNLIKTSITKRAIALIPKNVSDKFICAGEDLFIFGLSMKFANKYVCIENVLYNYLRNADDHGHERPLEKNFEMHCVMVNNLRLLLNLSLPKYYC